MAVKERRTKILLSLFLIGDVNFLGINLDEKLQKIFDLSLNQKTRGTLSGLIKEGLIEKSQILNPKLQTNPNDQSSKYKLTEKGFFELCLEFPFFRFLKNKWDGKLRVISYEIPGKKTRNSRPFKT